MRNENEWTNGIRWVLPVLALCCAAPANAGNIDPDEVRSGSLLLRVQDGFRDATALNTDVDMVISGLIARVTVSQEFENTSGLFAEAIYVFPLPDRAAVDRLRLRVGERFIEGEIRERARARKEYEDAKSAGRKTSLVEQQRPNLFTTSVANIAPGERVVVEIEYQEDLVYDNRRFGLRFPMTITPRYMPGTPLADRRGSGWSADTDRVADASQISPPMATRSANHRAAIRIDLDAGVPLASIASRYHPVNVVERNGRYRIELANPSVRSDHDFELEWTPAAGDAPQALGFVETLDGEAHLILLLLPPAAEPRFPSGMPREIIFVIDRSGSMHGTSIEQAREALERALERLGSGDRFNVIAFNDTARPLFAHSVPAEAGKLATAKRFVSGLKANGGTEMLPALALAFDGPVSETHLRQVVFITDGAVGNEDELFRLVDQKIGDGRLFTVGIGSAPNGWFMREAAETGRGTHTMISAVAEVGEKMDALFDRIAGPQATGIQVDWPGGVRVDAYPDPVPDLYAGQPVLVKARITGALRDADVVVVRGDTPAGAWQREVSLAGVRQSPGVAALWARARIEALADAGLRGRDAAEVRNSIVETALRYHLVSRHTSLVAVDRTPARPAGEPMQSHRVPNLMAYGQSRRAILGFPATATDAPRMRLIGACCLLLASLLMARRHRRRDGSVALFR